MSGGSMDYVYYHVDEAASMCEDAELSDLLHDASKVLHDEEWWKSADYSEDTYRESLAEFKAKWFRGDRAERLKGYVDKEIARCRKWCYSIIGPVTPDDVLHEMLDRNGDGVGLREFNRDFDAFVEHYADEIRAMFGEVDYD